MKNVIIDFRASQNTVDALLKLGFNVIKTPPLLNVYNSICGHPDIMLHKLCEHTVVCEPSVFDYMKANLQGYDILCGKTALKPVYPYDIAYNCARVGHNVFCNVRYTDTVILEYYKKNGFNIINTKQGYAKCSICIVSDNAIITSDKNISDLAVKNNIDVLQVENKSIKLEDFEYGFIGGATGLLDKNTLAFNGDIKTHKNCADIIEFCNLHDTNVISLNNDFITDIGSLIVI